MAEERVILVVLSDPPPGEEDEWNKWYVEKHIRDVFQFKGFNKATRYKLADPDPEGKHAKYMALYEFADAAALEEYDASAIRAAATEDWARRWQGKAAVKARLHYVKLGSVEQ